MIMKKLCKLLAIILVANLFTAGIAADESNFILEAEEAGNTSTSWLIKSYSSSSGGKSVVFNSDTWGEWDFDLEERGIYAFEAVYASSAGTNIFVSINDAKKTETELSASGTNNPNNGTNSQKIAELNLLEGQHSIRLENNGERFVLDCIRVYKTGEYNLGALEKKNVIKAEKYDKCENAELSGKTLKFSDGAYAEYGLYSAGEKIYKLSLLGEGNFNIFVNDEKIDKRIVLGKERIGIIRLLNRENTLKIVSDGESDLEAIEIDEIDKNNLKPFSGFKKIEFESYNSIPGEGHFFVNGTNVSPGGSGRVVGVNPGDWFKYDLNQEEAGAGIYKLCVSYASPSEIKIEFSGANGNVSNTLKSTGSFSDFKTVEIGSLKLNDTETVTARLVSTGNAGVTIDYFTLERTDLDFSYNFVVAQDDVIVLNEKIKRGTDRFLLYFTNYIDKEKLPEEYVRVYGDDGELPIKADVNENFITVDLLKTLDYNSKYSIAFDGIWGINGEEISTTDSILTSDENDDASVAEINVLSCKNEYNTVTLEGTVLSSVGCGIEGRKVNVKCMDEEYNQIAVSENSVLSQKDGKYKISFDIPEETPSQKVTISVKCEYADWINSEINYISKSFEEEFLSNISSAASYEDIKKLFEDNMVILNITIPSDLNGTQEEFYGRFLQKTYKTIDEVLKDFNRAITYIDIKNGDNKTDALMYSSAQGASDGENGVKMSANSEIYYNIDVKTSGYYIISSVCNVDTVYANILYDDNIMGNYPLAQNEETMTVIYLDAGKHSIGFKTTSAKDEFVLSAILINSVYDNGISAKGSQKIEFENYNPGENVGYYFKNGINVSNGGTGRVVGVNVGDWFMYDINTAGTGKYKITVSYSSPLSSVLVFETPDGVKMESDIPQTGSWSSYKSLELGEFELTGDTTTLKAYVNSAGMSIDYFILERTDIQLNYYAAYASGNVIAVNSEVKRGTDVIDIYLSYYPKESSVNSDNVYLEGNSKIPTVVETKNNVIRMSLLKSLDYENKYTIHIKNIEGLFGQKIKNDVKIPFVTGNTQNDDGKESIEIESYNITKNQISFSGVIKSSSDLGIENRKIKLSCKDSNENSIELSEDTVISGTGGKFNINCTIDKNNESGRYKFMLSGEYMTSPVTKELIYVSEEFEEEILKAVKNADTAEKAEEIFKTNEKNLAINTAEDMQELNNKTAVFEHFINAQYDSVNALIADYYMYIPIEMINEAENAEGVSKVLKNRTQADHMNIDFEKNLAIVNNQTAFYTAILKSSPYVDKEKFITKYNDLWNEYFLLEFNKNQTSLDIKSQTANPGQGVYIPLNTKDALSDVVSLTYKFKTDSKELFNGARINKNAVLKNENGEIEFELSDYKDAVLELTAQEGVGTRNISVDVYVTYKIKAANQNEYACVQKLKGNDISITTVSRESSSTGGSSSYGGGSKGSGTNIVIPSNPDDKKQDPEETKELFAFDDLDGVSWARESISELLKKKIISESNDKKFNPQREVTREEFVKMIVCALGISKDNAYVDFEDVNKDSWYYGYVASAVEYGIINGISDVQFGSGQNITRCDMAVIISRAIEKSGYVLTESEEKFSDDDGILQYAKSAVYKMKNVGIINGLENNIFDPNGNATRAMAAKVIYKMVEFMGL